MTRILLLQGHPTPGGGRLCHALADAYADGAEAAGHAVRRIAVADLSFPLLRSEAEWRDGAPPPDIARAQQDIAWAQHLVIVFPLWLGDMPALLKGFLEQMGRPGFALDDSANATGPRRLLTGRSARIVVTMGMPALIYRWVFGAHAVKLLRRNILHFVGIRPVRTSVVGMAGALGDRQAQSWFKRMRELGREAR